MDLQRRLGDVLEEILPVTREDDGALAVAGATAAAVGRRAFDAGIELHELRSRTSGLEEIYFELTAGRAQFAAHSPVATTDPEAAR